MFERIRPEAALIGFLVASIKSNKPWLKIEVIDESDYAFIYSPVLSSERLLNELHIALKVGFYGSFCPVEEIDDTLTFVKRDGKEYIKVKKWKD